MTDGHHDDVLGKLESSIFLDGPIRASALRNTAARYMENLVSVKSCYDEFVKSLPIAYMPEKLDPKELRGVIYRDASAVRMCALIAKLGDISEVMMYQLV